MTKTFGATRVGRTVYFDIETIDPQRPGVIFKVSYSENDLLKQRLNDRRRWWKRFLG